MQQFNKPNLDTLNNYMANSGGEQRIPWWGIPLGTSVVRILPPWDPTGRIALPVWSHRIEYREPGSSYNKYSWTCVEKTFGKPCNICAGLQRLKSANVNVDEYLPNSRNFYVNALVISDAAYDVAMRSGRAAPEGSVKPFTPVVMRTPKGVHDWVVAQIMNTMVGDITDVERGINIMIGKEGSGLNTKYTCSLAPDGRTAIPQEILQQIELINLDELFQTGFEDQRIETLVQFLSGSAGYLAGGGYAQAQNAMAGGGYVPAQNSGYVPQMPQYQQPQMPQYQVQQPYQQPPMQQPSPQMTQAPAPQMPPVQPQYQQPPAAPAMPNPGAVPSIPGIGSQFAAAPAQPQYPQQPPANQPPFDPTQSPAPQLPPTSATSVPNGAPKCYGAYNPANANCVICASELPCRQSSGKA